MATKAIESEEQAKNQVALENGNRVAGKLKGTPSKERVGVKITAGADLRPGQINTRGEQSERHIHQPDSKVLPSGPSKLDPQRFLWRACCGLARISARWRECSGSRHMLSGR